MAEKIATREAYGKAPNDEQFAQAKAELEAQIKELEG